MMAYAYPPKPIRVLLVEDCRLVRIGIRAILDEHPGFDVVGEVDSGELAIPLADSLRPDVVLIDLGLPGMSGIETIHAMKAKNIPSRFVILTSHESEDEILGSLKSGAHAYCIKNIASDRLTDVLFTVHEGAVWLDPGIAAIALKHFHDYRGSHVESAEAASRSKLRDSLTERELAILQLLVDGKSNNDIAKELYISVHTAKFYVSNLLEKLAVTDRVQAAVRAVREGLVQ